MYLIYYNGHGTVDKFIKENSGRLYCKNGPLPIDSLLSPLVDYIIKVRMPKEPYSDFFINVFLDCCGAAGAYYLLKKDQKYCKTKNLHIEIWTPCDWNEVSFSCPGRKGGKWSDY